ncbi:MAG: acyl-ACP--UDP-N-acetylglucosamine O-acyltransferase [Candidatus Omnitrophica bacterium]|nr:acyl-ACP--UDP-N-acetylglucosamine O-acyltransferase [Candidatus Omnitrophota bacterium]
MQKIKIHPTAIIDKRAKISDEVEVGPYAIIGPNVKVDKGTKIGAFCVLDGYTEIGENCQIFSNAVVGTIPQDLKFKGEKTSLKIGSNNIIREFVTINTGTTEGGKTSIGDNNLFMAYSHIAHDCKVGNNCIVANNGTLAGFVTLEDRAVIGGLSAVHQYARVGTLSIIGGCSKVVQDIPPYSTCDGHPAKVYGLNLVGLKRAGIPKDVILNLKHAFKFLFFSQLTIKHAVEKIQKEITGCKEVTNLVKFVISSERGICR